MRRVFVLLFTIIILTTPVYAEVKVVGDPCYTGDVRMTSQVINTQIPVKVQEAYEACNGFVWIKKLGEGQLTTQLTTASYVIEVDPKINWEMTRLTVLRQFGSFLDKYQKVTQDSSKRAVIQNEVSRYQALCEELSYNIPECYSPETLFEIVFAAKCATDMVGAGDILTTCPETVKCVQAAYDTIETTVTLSVKTYSVQTDNASTNLPSRRDEDYQLPIMFKK